MSVVESFVDTVRVAIIHALVCTDQSAYPSADVSRADDQHTHIGRADDTRTHIGRTYTASNHSGAEHIAAHTTLGCGIYCVVVAGPGELNVDRQPAANLDSRIVNSVPAHPADHLVLDRVYPVANPVAYPVANICVHTLVVCNHLAYRGSHGRIHHRDPVRR